MEREQHARTCRGRPRGVPALRRLRVPLIPFPWSLTSGTPWAATALPEGKPLHRKFGIGPLLVVCVSAGCATQQNEGMSEAAETAGTLDGTLVDQFEVARERATSDFEHEILDRAIENGELTQKDYEEAFNRYQECTEAAGLDETFRKMPAACTDSSIWEGQTARGTWPRAWRTAPSVPTGPSCVASPCNES